MLFEKWYFREICLVLLLSDMLMHKTIPSCTLQCTAGFGKVTSGMEIVDKIKRGEGPNGSVLGEPDKMVSVVASD